MPIGIGYIASRHQVSCAPHATPRHRHTGTARPRVCGVKAQARSINRTRTVRAPRPRRRRRAGGARPRGPGLPVPPHGTAPKRFPRTRHSDSDERCRQECKSSKKIDLNFRSTNRECEDVRRNVEEKRGILSHRFLTRGGGVPMGTVHKGPCNATQRRPRRSIPTRHSTVLVIRVHVTGAVAFGLRCTRELCVLRSCEDPRPGSARAQSRSRRRRARTSES